MKAHNEFMISEGTVLKNSKSIYLLFEGCDFKMSMTVVSDRLTGLSLPQGE